ncbi:hypothetical protein [Streptomyces sp. NPDC001388]|uniref:hypothetical protein n=1 Tax=Streptomyces sp. NPDC001388 TaxID=3364568 RepID=UPI0036B8F8C4
MTWALPEPMLTTPVSVPDLRPDCAAEPKWDGFRALIFVDAGRVVLRSRRGTEMAAARNTAMMEALAGLPPIVISDLVGISPVTAHRWARLAGARSDYLAIRQTRLSRLVSNPGTDVSDAARHINSR